MRLKSESPGGRGEKYEGDWKEGKQTGQGKVPTAPPLSANSSFEAHRLLYHSA